MPNHISTRLTLHCDNDTAAVVFARIGGDSVSGEVTLPVDFSKIVPVPPHVFQGNLSQADIKRYGAENCWYDWNCKHWGTKWNAYSPRRITNTQVIFETAWSVAEPVFDAISALFPGVNFTVEYADENIGYNSGVINYSDKTKRHLRLDKRSAARLWFDINGGDPAECGYDPVTYDDVPEPA